MKKILLSTLLLILSYSLFGQVTNIEKGAADIYTKGVPTGTVRIKYDSEWAINTLTSKLYRYDRNANSWLEAGSFVGFFNSASAPVQAPKYGAPEFVINTNKELYWYNSSAWHCLNCAALGYTAGPGIDITGTVITNTDPDQDITNELQYIDSLYMSNDTLFISLDRDSIPSSFVKLSGLGDGNGIYGGSDTIPDNTYAFADSSKTFALGQFPSFPSLTTNGTSRGFYYDTNIKLLNGDYSSAWRNEISLEPNINRVRVLTVPPTHQSSIFQSAYDKDASYLNTTNTADNLYGNLNIVSKLDSIQELLIWNQSGKGDTLGVSMYLGSGDANSAYYKEEQRAWGIKTEIPGDEEFHWLKIILPGTDDTTGNGIQLYEKYAMPNLTPSATLADSSVIVWVGDGTTSNPVFLPYGGGSGSSGTDTSGYNLSFELSNDTLYITDGDGTLFVVLPEDINTDDQNLTIDSVTISTGERYELSIEDGNTIYFDDDDAQDLSLTGNILSLTNDLTTVDLSGYLDNTDSQTLSLDSAIVGDLERFELSISGGNTIYFDVNTSTGTDDQIITVDSTIVGNLERWEISIEDGNTFFMDIPQGTVTSVDITQPAAGITTSGGPITSSGSITLALANDLAAVEGLASNGIAVRTGSDTWTTRTITGGTEINVANGDGVSGNPTLTLEQQGATTGQVLKWNGSTWSPGTDNTGGGGGSGEANRGENIGAGEVIYAGMNDTLLQFKTLVELYGINITSDADEVFIEVDTAQIATLYDVSVVQADIDAHELADGDLSATNEIQNLGYTQATGVVTIDGAGSTDATILVMTNTFRGLVPDGDGTNNGEFLQEDGSWAIPPGTADGSETIVQEGTGIDVTGTGTSGDPYIVSSTVTNTDNQTLAIDSTTLTGIERYEISISNGNSIFLDDDDNQTIDTFEIVSNVLRLSLLDDNLPFSSVDLSPYLDNTDDQQLTLDSVTVGSLERFELTLEDGGIIYFDIPQPDGTGTDDQTLSIDSTIITGGERYEITIESGNTIYLDDDNNSGLTIENASNPELGTTTSATVIPLNAGSGISVTGNGTSVTFENTAPDQIVTIASGTGIDIDGSYPSFTVNSTVVNTDNQIVDTFEIVSNILRLSLEDDGLPFNSVDLAPYLDNTDAQGLTITGASSPFTIDISGSSSDVNIAEGTGITLSESPANTLVITNSSPDQTVSLTSGTGINVTGTYPNFTINSTITNTDDQKWNEIVAPDGNTSMTHGAHTTAFTFNGVTNADAFTLSSSSLTGGSLLRLEGTGPSDELGSNLVEISYSGENSFNFPETSSLFVENKRTRPGNTGTNRGLLVEVDSLIGGIGISINARSFGSSQGINVYAGGTGVVNTYAAYLDASGGSSNNYALYTLNGQVRIGDLTGTGNRLVFANSGGVLFDGTIGAGLTYSAGTIIADQQLTIDSTDEGSDRHFTLSIENGNSVSWTVPQDGGGGGGYYQTFEDEGTPVTQRDVANFVQTATINPTLTDDSGGGGETDITFDVRDGSIGATQVADNSLTATDLNVNVVSSLDGVTNDGANIDLIQGGIVTITPDDGANTITISATEAQNLFQTISVSGQSNVVADATTDVLTLVNGTGIAITTNATTDAVTVTNTAPDQTVALTEGTGIDVTGTYPNFTIATTVVNTDDQTLSLDSTTVGDIERFSLSIEDGNTVHFDVAVPDGSETILQEGTDIDITGTGTSGDPYIINSDWSEPSTQIVSGTGTGRTSSADFVHNISGNTITSADTINTTKPIRSNVPSAWHLRMLGRTDLGFLTQHTQVDPTAVTQASAAYYNWNVGVTTSSTAETAAPGLRFYKAMVNGSAEAQVPAAGQRLATLAIQSHKGQVTSLTDFYNQTNGAFFLQVQVDSVSSGGAVSTRTGLFAKPITGSSAAPTGYEFLYGRGNGDIYFPAYGTSRDDAGTPAVVLSVDASNRVTAHPIADLGIGADTDDQTLTIDSTDEGSDRHFTLDIEDGNSVSWTVPQGSTDVNVYDDDGNVQDGGTVIDVSGNDPLIFSLDADAAQANRIIRMEVDYSSDDAFTYFTQYVSPSDSLYITSYDSGIMLDYEGPDGTGTALTVSSNTMINFAADSLMFTTVPSKPVLQTLWGGWGNTLSSIQGTANGDVLVWDEDNGYWEVGTASGGGGGIYSDGANTIGAAVVATLQENDEFDLRWFNTQSTIYINDSSGEIYLGAQDASTYIGIENDYVVFNTDSGAEFEASALNLSLSTYEDGIITLAVGELVDGQLLIRSNDDITHTTGDRNTVEQELSFLPTSGTGTYTDYLFNTTINQTGGANGITRGIRLNQTLTAVADFRGVEIDYSGADVAGAWGIYQVDSDVLNHFNGHLLLGTTTNQTGYNLSSAGPIRTEDGHVLIRGNGNPATETGAAAVRMFNTTGSETLDIGVEDDDEIYIGTGSGEIAKVNTDGTWQFNFGRRIVAAPGTDETVSGDVITLTANETQAFGDVCYIQADGDAALADASALSTSYAFYLCTQAATATNPAVYLRSGTARDDTWNWTPGQPVYLTITGTTGNTLSQTKPSSTGEVVFFIGMALTADVIDFNPTKTPIELQ